MSEKENKLIHRVYGILLSLLLVIVGICLIISCVDIYNSGERPFNRESISEHFRAISLPIYLTLAAIVGGFVLHVALPQTEKEKTKLTARQLLALYRRRFDLKEAGEKVAQGVLKERRMRRLFTLGAGILCAVFSGVSLIYLLNGNNFSVENLNGDIFRAIGVVMAVSVLLFCIGVLHSAFTTMSMQREIALIKSAPKADPAPHTPTLWEEKGIWILRVAVLVAAVVLIVLGILNGGMKDVLAKAIRICTECIGLG